MRGPVHLGQQAALAHQASWTQLHRRWGRGWLEVHPGFMVSFSGVPIAAFNGASVYDACDRGALIDPLRRIAAHDMPYSLQCRPAGTETAERVAAELGLEPEIGAPLMVCTAVPDEPAPDGLEIRLLRPGENHVHARILAEAFGAPLDVAIELNSEAILAPANVWTLLGEYRGRAVSTAFVDLQAGVGHIHNVATLPGYRGRGFAAAVTTAAMRLAGDAGAEFAMLLSSPMAVGVYESIGFHEIERWSAWQSPHAV